MTKVHGAPYYKYKFTFLLDEKSYEYPAVANFDNFIQKHLLDNRDSPDKIAIMLDYFYRQKLPAGRENLEIVSHRAYYDFKVRSVVASTLNMTLTSRVIERYTAGGEQTTLSDIVQLIASAGDFLQYNDAEKYCITWTDDFNLAQAANCSVESVEFWNRVLPNVDAAYECHVPALPEYRPTFTTGQNSKIIGRPITEFGRPGVNTYFGVPYAKSPVGTFRFKRPAKPDHVDEVDAGLYKSECARNIPDKDYTSEDCLYLDIWQPVVITEPKWTLIYFCDGYISLFGAAGNEIPRTRCRNWMGYFTEDHDVISIHINYRQGLFGFGTDLDSIPSNIGFADQAMALDWIYENLETLGGDSSMIAFVGQGFGGITALLHAKKYQPTRIISSSATLNMKFPYTNSPQSTAQKVLKKLGCSSSFLNCLSDLTTVQVVSASQNVGNWPFGLVIDGDLIENIDMIELGETDIMFGFNDGDAFGWANNQFNFLNKHPLGLHFDELETIEEVIKRDFMQQTNRTTEADLELLFQLRWSKFNINNFLS